MSKVLTKFLLIAAAAAFTQGSAHAAGQEKTAAISAESNAARTLRAPASLSTEERAKMKPLDSNITKGKQSQRPMSAEDLATLQNAVPSVSESGAADPKAVEELMRQFPEEQKTQDQQ